MHLLLKIILITYFGQIRGTVVVVVVVGGYIPNTINSDFQELRRGHIGGSTFHLDNYNKNLKKVKTSGGGGGDGGYENDMKRDIQCTRKTPTALAKIGLNSCCLLYKNK